MKKKALLVCVALLMAMMIVVGCGGNGDALSGTYKLSGAEVGGQEYSGDQLQSMMTMLGVSVDMSFTFSGTDQVVMDADVLGQTGSVEGTYTLNGQALTITIEGQELATTFTDGKIYLEQSGTTLIFSK